MRDAFDDLCGLVSKGGVCHQCAGLRENAPSSKRGDEPPDLSGDRDESLRRRLTIVRDADLVTGQSAALHELMFELVGAGEESP